MNKMIKSSIITITCSILCGCANITVRPQADYNCGPYYCTKVMNKLITKGNTDGFLTKIMLPVFYLDWPFDALTDTLLLPYDYIAYTIRMKKSLKRDYFEED